jgi:xylulokinase
VQEGAAFGAALLGGVAGGMWSDPAEAVSACVSVRSTVDPDPAWVAAYEQPLARYRALYPAVRPLSD